MNPLHHPTSDRQPNRSTAAVPRKETKMKTPSKTNAADELQEAVMKILLEARRRFPGATSSKDPELRDLIWDAIVKMTPTIEKFARRAARDRHVDEYDVATKSSDGLRQTLGQMIVGNAQLPSSITAIIATAVDRKATSLQTLECNRSQKFAFASLDDETLQVVSRADRASGGEGVAGGFVLVAFEQRVALDRALQALDKLPRLERVSIIAAMLGTPDDIAAGIYNTTPNALRVARCTARRKLRALIDETNDNQEVAA
jgi:hypothetical protein